MSVSSDQVRHSSANTAFQMGNAIVVPQNWAVKLLPQICNFRSGKAHEPFISDLGDYVCVNSKFISTDGQIRKHCTRNGSPAREGDILMVMSDLPGGRALAKAYLTESDNVYAVNQRVCALTPYQDDSRFLYFALNRSKYFLKFDDGVNQTHLLNHVFAKCPVLLPPLPEQRAIAEALSDVDELIGALDKLIAKKRAIKLATMQQLLTGKTRLPGFSGEWEAKTLGELAAIQRGASPRPIESPMWFDTQSKIGWVRISDIANSDGQVLLVTRDYLSSKGVAASRLIPSGTLIMSICATVGRPVVTGFETCIHDGFVSFLNLRYVDQRFLFYTLKALEPEFASMGQTGSQANLNTNLVTGCKINLPPLDEQAAIAQVLSDMDAEIAAVKNRLDKTRAIKQGMMQSLLTGRVRLVKGEAKP